MGGAVGGAVDRAEPWEGGANGGRGLGGASRAALQEGTAVEIREDVFFGEVGPGGKRGGAK